MRARVAVLWETVRSSYWFVPTLMLAASIGLALGAVALDQRLENDSLQNLWWIYAGGPDGARAVLSTIAGSVITVAGVTFSITIAALSLASSQYGPRLLRNFIRDEGNHVVLGTFIGTFLYCLLVLRTVRGDEGIAGSLLVPHVSVTLGVVLAIASLGLLIYFIHHVAASIQASNIIGTVGRELDEAIDRLYPEELGRGAADPACREEAPEGFDREATPVAAAASGYLQAVDTEALMRVAVEEDLLLRLTHRPGGYVVRGSEAARAWRRDRGALPIRQEVGERINDAFTVNNQRTLTQDVEFAVNQLVEVAVRALSPGVNDPFTAMMCVDRLAAGLCHLAGRQIPSPCRCDDQGRLRVIADAVTFPGLVNSAFDQIRQYGRTSASVTLRLLEAIAVIADCARTEEQRAALRRQARMVERGSRDGLPEEEDRREVAARFRRAMQALNGATGTARQHPHAL